MKKIKYLLLFITLFITSGCSITEINEKFDISKIDKIIILSCLGTIIFSILIILIILLTKVNDKKKIDIEEQIENSEEEQ